MRVSQTTPLVVILMDGDGGVELIGTSDLGIALARRHRKGRLVLPVAAVETDPTEFTRATGLMVPSTMTLAEAAALFGRARVALPAQPALHRHLRRLGVDASRELLVSWARAVRAAEDSRVSA